MNRKTVFIIIFFTIGFQGFLISQNTEIKAVTALPSYLSTYHSFKAELERVSNVEDEKSRIEQINLFWKFLKNGNKIPFTYKDSAAFLYRGDKKSVAFQGDFSSWSNDKSAKTKAKRIGKGDIWILEQTFPSDSRIDYKIVLNDTNWILDPDNNFRQMSGFGPNSELRMPDWIYPPETIRSKDIPMGIKSETILIKSNSLGYDVNYVVYTPNGYEKMNNLPVIYVTDGHEYSDDEKGSMIITLDNLIGKKKIKPVIAVFIDPREPGKPENNRRESEFLLNEKYADFVTKELIPFIDKNYKTNPWADERAILGTSYGGALSTYFGVTQYNSFHKVAIMSPAYWRVQKLYDMFKKSDQLPLKIFLSTGTISDGELLTRGFKNLLQEKKYPLLYKEVNEGHSWGNWRALIDDMLIYFWGI